MVSQTCLLRLYKRKETHIHCDLSSSFSHNTFIMKLTFPAGIAIAGRSVNTEPTLQINGIGHLPCELVIEILSRVSIKDISKFKTVSKNWHHLLSNDTQVITRHRELSRQTPLMLFRKYSSEKGEDSENSGFSIELTSMDMEGNSLKRVKASISGPVYTFTSSGPLVLLSSTYQVYVCNPGTQEFVSVPPSFVPRYFTIGFGYLPESNEHKIVHLFSREPFTIGEEEMGCEIFTLRDGESPNSGNWKRIQDCPCTVPTNCSPVCVNGVLYWKVCKESNIDSILCLNLGTEQFSVISYPKCYSGSTKKMLFLTGFRGCLSLLDCSSSAMEIWVLKSNGDQTNWAKAYSVRLSGFGNSKMEIKGVVPSDDINGEILINTEQNGLGYYNVEHESFNGIKNSGEVEWYKKPCLYYDDFFSLKSAP